MQTWQLIPLLPEAPAPLLLGVKREEHGVSGSLLSEETTWLGVLGIHDLEVLLVALMEEPEPLSLKRLDELVELLQC